MSAKIFASLGKGITYPFRHLGQLLILAIVFIAEAFALNYALKFATEDVMVPAIILTVVAILIALFIGGTTVKLMGRKEKIFSLGNIGRGFQGCIISLIYQIIAVIIAAIVCAVGIGATIGLDTLATATAGSGAIWGAIAGLGVWGVLILILTIFFSIFMMPALVNFAVQGKFGAAFHFKEIFAMIGQAKWYKILLGILVLTVIEGILLVIVGAIVGFVANIGAIIGGIVGLLLMIALFFIEPVFWAEMFNPENK